MLLRAVLIDALHAALEDREVVLAGVDVEFFDRPLVALMVDGDVVESCFSRA
jgi:hypothetical protein